jgi:hypothetical protein
MSGFIDKMQIYKIKIDDNSMQISGKLSNNLAIEEIWKKVETLR